MEKICENCKHFVENEFRDINGILVHEGLCTRFKTEIPEGMYKDNTCMLFELSEL